MSFCAIYENSDLAKDRKMSDLGARAATLI